MFDEPTTGLDFGHQARFLTILDALRAAGRTIVMWVMGKKYSVETNPTSPENGNPTAFIPTETARFQS